VDGQNTETVVIQRMHLQKRGGYIYNFRGILGRGPLWLGPEALYVLERRDRSVVAVAP